MRFGTKGVGRSGNGRTRGSVGVRVWNAISWLPEALCYLQEGFLVEIASGKPNMRDGDNDVNNLLLGKK